MPWQLLVFGGLALVLAGQLLVKQGGGRPFETFNTPFPWVYLVIGMLIGTGWVLYKRTPRR